MIQPPVRRTSGLSAPLREGLRHLRAPAPLVFPVEGDVPESYAHLVVRTFLFRLLAFALGPQHTVGSEQFIYWDPSDPKRALAPDVFVHLGLPQPARLDSWKTWVLGRIPELAVEIVSPNDGQGAPWKEKLARYHQLGVRELVRFDPEAAEGSRLRVWDRVEDDLVERSVEADQTPCLSLDLRWTVRAISNPNGATEHLGLRLAHENGRLVPTREEFDAEALAAEARARVEEARGRAEEARGRAEAEERVRALEETLRTMRTPAGRGDDSP